MALPASEESSPIEVASRIRILRVIARLNVGGPAHHVSLLTVGLDPSRFETTLVTGQVGAGEKEMQTAVERAGSNLVRLPSLGPSLDPVQDFKATAELVRMIRTTRPDIVATHTAKAGFTGRLAALLAGRPRPIIVHTFHGHVLDGYFGRLKTTLYKTLEQLLAHVTDRFVAVSQRTVDDLVALRIAPRAKFKVIPLGLDLSEMLNSTAADGAGFRDEFGIKPEEKLIVILGRLAPIKRMQDAITAFARLSAKHPEARLAVVGDGEEREALERIAASFDLGDRIIFTGFRSDLKAVHAATDIALLTSANEGTPVSLIEAAAAATPIVATRAGGVPEVVTDEMGFVVGIEDVDAIANACEQLLNDGDLRERMGAAGRERVRVRHSAERLYSDITELYEQLLSERNR